MTESSNYRSIRVSEWTHRALRKLSVQSGESMTALVDRAVEHYRRERLFAEAEIAYRELETNPAAMAELDSEYALWETTVSDGLEREEW